MPSIGSEILIPLCELRLVKLGMLDCPFQIARSRAVFDGILNVSCGSQVNVGFDMVNGGVCWRPRALNKNFIPANCREVWSSTKSRIVSGVDGRSRRPFTTKMTATGLNDTRAGEWFEIAKSTTVTSPS
jgi:hypothetical protein